MLYTKLKREWWEICYISDLLHSNQPLCLKVREGWKLFFKIFEKNKLHRAFCDRAFCDRAFCDSGILWSGILWFGHFVIRAFCLVTLLYGREFLWPITFVHIGTFLNFCVSLKIAIFSLSLAVRPTFELTHIDSEFNSTYNMFRRELRAVGWRCPVLRRQTNLANIVCFLCLRSTGQRQPTARNSRRNILYVELNSESIWASSKFGLNAKESEKIAILRETQKLRKVPMWTKLSALKIIGPKNFRP